MKTLLFAGSILIILLFFFSCLCFSQKYYEIREKTIKKNITEKQDTIFVSFYNTEKNDTLIVPIILNHTSEYEQQIKIKMEEANDN
jgi:hypothetical protein